MAEQPKCETCRYWDKPYLRRGSADIKVGYCCRFAPAPRVFTGDEDVDNGDAAWAITYADQWCGEHSELQVVRQIEAAKFGPNDAILVSSESPVSMDAKRNITEHIKSFFGSSVPVLVMSGGLKLSIINKEKAEELCNDSHP